MDSEDLPAITNDFLFHHLQEIVCYRWEVLISLSLSNNLRYLSRWSLLIAIFSQQLFGAL